MIDIAREYELDELNCYQHVVADAVYFRNEEDDYHTYILLAKFLEIYNNGYIVNITKMNEYQPEIIKKTMLNHKWIKKCVNDGYPVIIPINLKEIYYSKYYGKSNWPHYILITGVERDVYEILDNQHIDGDKPEYNRFYITKRLLKTAYKSYVYSYDNKKEIVAIKGFNKIKFEDVLETIINSYNCLSFDDFNLYWSKRITIEYIELKKMINQNKISLYNIYEDDKFFNEFKIKLLNLIKSKAVFLNLIIDSIYDIDNEYINVEIEYRELKDEVTKLISQWKQWTYITLIEISRKGTISKNNIFEESIMCKEKKIAMDIKKLYEKKKQTSHTQETRKLKNKDTVKTKTIVDINGNNLKYNNNLKMLEWNICGRNVLNWWEMDDALKYSIVNKLSVMECTDVYMIIRNIKFINCNSENNEMVQVGLYITILDIDSTFTIGIQNDGQVVFSEIGKSEKIIDCDYDSTELVIKAKDINIKPYKNIFIGKKSLLSIGYREKKREVYTEVFNISNKCDIDMGIYCKTWDNPVKCIARMEMQIL